MILIVEDSDLLAGLITRRLEETIGAATVVAADAAHAMEAMRLQPPPDFIFLDLGLPDSRAVDTVRLIPEFAKLNPKAPVCVLSGTVDEKLEQSAMALGADYFMKKQEFTSQRELWIAMKTAWEKRRAAGASDEEIGTNMLQRLNDLIYPDQKK